MTTLRDYLTAEHQACDHAFVEAENAIAAKDWAAGAKHFGAFRAQTEAHFGKEEQILFPALTDAMGGHCPPVGVMQHEHAQLRDMMAQLAEAVQRRDADAYLGLSETLLMLLQQHNHKEEVVLYVMADRLLAATSEAVFGAPSAP